MTSAPRSASAVVIAAGPSIETSMIRTPASRPSAFAAISTFPPRTGPGPYRCRVGSGLSTLRRLGRGRPGRDSEQARHAARQHETAHGHGSGDRGAHEQAVGLDPADRLAQRYGRAGDPGPQREAELVRELDRRARRALSAGFGRVED